MKRLVKHYKKLTMVTVVNTTVGKYDSNYGKYRSNCGKYCGSYMKQQLVLRLLALRLLALAKWP